MSKLQIVWADELIDAIRDKWKEEYPVEGDPGHTTYADIIRFINEFVEKNGLLGKKKEGDGDG